MKDVVTCDYCGWTMHRCNSTQVVDSGVRKVACAICSASIRAVLERLHTREIIEWPRLPGLDPTQIVDALFEELFQTGGEV